MAVLASVITVGVTPTLLTLGGHTVKDLRTTIVRNDTAADLFVGGLGVTTATGLRVPAASSIALDLGPLDSLYGVVAVAAPIQVLTTRV